MSSAVYLPKSKVTVTISPVLPHEYADVCRIRIEAFVKLNDVIVNSVYPPERRPPIAERVLYAISRLKKEVQQGSKTFMKATLENGEIVGYAQWRKPGVGLKEHITKTEEQIKKEEEEQYMEGMDVAFTNRFFDALDEMHEKHMAGVPHWYLGILVVDPNHQGQGIGQAMLQWAIDQADSADPPVEMWLESSEEALRVYEKGGFRIVDAVEMENEKGELARRDCMIRPARKVVAATAKK